MKTLKFLTLAILSFWGALAFGQDENVWMYGWRPAATQELYDFYIERLYVTKPYVQEDYERDVFNLYSRLQISKKLSDYCQGKIKEEPSLKYISNIKSTYQAWRTENNEYIEQINSLWDKIAKNLNGDKKIALLGKIEQQNKDSILSLERYHDVSQPCWEVSGRFAYADYKGKIIGKASEDKRFSDAYRNVDFFLHPEKKENFIKVLKAQLDAGLAGEKACKKSGGIWKPVGMRGSMACITKYPDAGKSCTDSSQCKGGCLDMTPYNHKGNPIGKCREDDDVHGCFSYLKKGERGGSNMCID